VNNIRLNMRNSAKILLPFALLFMMACARKPVVWQAKTALVFVPVGGASFSKLDEVQLGKKMISKAFRTGALARDPKLETAVSHMDMTFGRYPGMVEIMVSASSREACLKAAQAYVDAAVDLAAKSESVAGDNFDVRLAEAPAVVGESK